MALIFVNRYCHPDQSATSQMMTGIVCALAEQGREVIVVTSRQRYDEPAARLPASDAFRGVTIRRIWTTTFGRGNLAGRAVDYASFYLSAAWTLLRLARRGDVVIVKTDPPMLAVALAPVAKFKGAHLVNWLQDLFPEVIAGVGMARGSASRRALKVLAHLRNMSLRSGAANVAIGERMAARLGAAGVETGRIHIIPNWADGDALLPVDPAQNDLRRDWGLAGKFVVGYSGNLGRAHDYETFLDAAAILESQQRAGTLTTEVTWLFIGAGAQSKALADAAAARGLKSIMFKPYQPQELLAQSLSAADVHLVSLKPALEGLIVPSKYYGITAVGRPAIFIGDADGEIARLIRDAGCGLTVPPGDGPGLAAKIAWLARSPDETHRLGRNARHQLETRHDLPHAVARWSALIASLAPPRPG